MKTIERFFDQLAIQIVIRLSPRGILSFVITIVALNMLFPSVGQSGALPARMAREYHIQLWVIGAALLAGEFLAYSNLHRLWTRVLGNIPFWLFIVGCWGVTAQQELSWQGAIVYTGMGLLLSYLLAADYVRSLHEIPS